MFVAFAVSLQLILSASVQASQRFADICDRAAEQAATKTSVPVEVLLALTRTETGRSTPHGWAPWPWTVNMEGSGHWFDTRDEALSFAFHHFKNGIRSFDVGCFQINYKWHGSAFVSIADMFDPDQNALHAAEFLLSLFGEFGDWSRAAGTYHSRTEKLALAYAERFTQIRNRLPEHRVSSSPKIRTNHWHLLAISTPLIGSGHPTKLGSVISLGGPESNRQPFSLIPN